ncbi:ankyrin repeat protein [Histoplasma ohiense]|nr:ankyrin repeat protein [Histoplasma ohiense (nom. inval.)]
MQYLHLPNEIFLALGEILPLADLNSLLQTNRRLFSLLNADLYRYGASSALLWAAEYGDEDIARKALRAGASLRSLGTDDKTALIIACERGHVKVVELLLAQNSVDLNGVVNDWSAPDPKIAVSRLSWRTMSPLLFAAHNNHADVLKLLLDQPGVNPHFTDSGGWSVLHYATKNECEVILKLLLENDRIAATGVDGSSLVLFAFQMNRYSAMLSFLSTDRLEIDLHRHEADDILLHSLRMGYSGIVKKLLVLPNFSAESEPLYQWTTQLAFAVVNGDKEAVSSLLTNSAVDPNSQEDFFGFSPLLLAVCMEKEAIVRLLLAVDNVNPNIPDRDGRSPLWVAAAFGNAELARLLLGKDMIDVNQRDQHNWTPLTIASELGHVAVVKLLIERDDLEVDVACTSGWTPLGAAVGNQHYEIARLLLETNRVELNGEITGPPLWTAVRNNDLPMVELLLATEGVNPNGVSNVLRIHPLSEAISQGNVDIVERLLRREDVNVNYFDIGGYTPLESVMLQLSGDVKQRIVELLSTKGAVRGQELLLVHEQRGD